MDSAPLTLEKVARAARGVLVAAQRCPLLFAAMSWTKVVASLCLTISAFAGFAVINATPAAAATGDDTVLAVGDATFAGSTSGVPLSQPVVGLAARPNGDGYWEVARDGGVFNFGRASFLGSTGDIRLGQLISPA